MSGLTLAWDLIEGVVATVAGAAAGSVALIGFGVDSLAEMVSATVVGARFAYEVGTKGREEERGERIERFELIASRIAGGLLLLVALYIAIDSVRRLLGYGAEPRTSVAGIVLTAVALPIMGLLAWGKLRTARAVGSRALRADAYESVSCAWLAAATLIGLVLNAAFGWWWADPVAALVLIPLIVREGLEGIRGEECDDEEE
ncbi:MAG TPA: cation transporter [Thermoanaerobaculia bacterium]|nr:cation transporter [Thermoanaerobaculia bacterium]